MANTIWMESGGDATYGLESYSTINSPTVVSTNPHTGPRCIRSVDNGKFWKGGLLADAGRRISFWFLRETTPSGDINIFTAYTSGLAAINFSVALINTNVFRLYSSSTPLDTGASILSVDTWYRISIGYTITSGSVSSIRVYLNGTLELSADNGTGVTTTSDAVLFGCNSSGETLTCRYDDIYIDDGSDLTDTGDRRVTAKLPTTATNNNFDTTGGTGAVNERPLSETNYKQHQVISDVRQDYVIEGADSGDVTVGGNTLIARLAWIWAKGTAGGAGTPGIVNNGTVTGITLTAAPAMYTNIVDSASYPTDSSAVGMRSTNDADDSFLYECGMLIAFVGAPTPGAPSATLMGAICM